MAFAGAIIFDHPLCWSCSAQVGRAAVLVWCATVIVCGRRPHGTGLVQFDSRDMDRCSGSRVACSGIDGKRGSGRKDRPQGMDRKFIDLA